MSPRISQKRINCALARVADQSVVVGQHPFPGPRRRPYRGRGGGLSGPRPLHDDEAGALEVLHKPLRYDLRHDLIGCPCPHCGARMIVIEVFARLRAEVRSSPS